MAPNASPHRTGTRIDCARSRGRRGRGASSWPVPTCGSRKEERYTDGRRDAAGGFGLSSVHRRVICPARNAASFPTQPSSAEPAGVLPRQAQHVQAGGRRHAACVQDAAALVGHVGDVDPRVVGREAGRPHHGVVFRGAAVGKRHRPPGRARRPGPDAGCRGGGRAAAVRVRSPGPARPAAFPAGNPRSPCPAAGRSPRPRCRGPAAAAGSPGSAARQRAPRRGSRRAPRRSGTRSSRRRRPGPSPAGSSAGAGSERCAPGARHGRALRRSAG